jgi:hypothetical protein
MIGVFWASWVVRFPAQRQANMAELKKLYTAGAIQPVLPDRFGLANTPEAFGRLATAVGNLVIMINLAKYPDGKSHGEKGPKVDGVPGFAIVPMSE